jgi:hypothetical protein
MNNLRNMFLGICEITDGLVRLLSFGFIHTTFAFNWLLWWEKNVVLRKEIESMKHDR